MSDTEKQLKCGFCRRGFEAQNVCGKLWHDAAKNCSAHQRCMQYSANLAQYNMKRFGGFKVPKVLKEQARGKRLKCTICGAGSKSKSKSHSACGASSGCADPKCRKSFHFFCARTGAGTVAHKMVETMSDGRKVDHYLVFCSKEHQQRYEKKQKNRVSYVADTDDEAYRSDAKDDSSDSDESTSSDDKKTAGDSPPAQVRVTANDSVAQTNNNVTRSSGSLDSNDKWSDDDFDKTPTNAARRDEKTKTATAGKQKSSEESVGDVKRRKLAAEAGSLSVDRTTNVDVKADPDNAATPFVICFVEHVERVTGAVTQALQSAAHEYFGVSADKMFVWQYNGDRLGGEHFIYLLNEIGKALACQDRSTASRLVFNMVDSDVAEFNTKIKLNAALDNRTRAVLYADLRKQIARNFSHANEQCHRSVCRYCHVMGGLDEDVAFVLVADYAIVSESESAEMEEMETDQQVDDTDQMERLDVGKEKGSKGAGKKAMDPKDSVSGKIDRKAEKLEKKCAGDSEMDVDTGSGLRVEVQQKSDQEKLDIEKEKRSNSKGKKEGDKEKDKSTISKQREKITADNDNTRSVGNVKDAVEAGEAMDGSKVEVRKVEGKNAVNEKEDMDEKGDKKVNKLRKKITTVDDDKGSVETKKAANNGAEIVTREKCEESVSVASTSVEIYRWDTDTTLVSDVGDVDKTTSHNLEFDRLSKYLKRQVDSETAFVRYPAAADFAILSPSASQLQLSVTSRLADIYTDAKAMRSTGAENDQRGVKTGNGLKAANDNLSAMASSVIFIGPYDTAVVNHGEIVRRHITAVVDMLPVDRSVYCITDVGHDVGLLCLADIFDASKYRNIAVNAHVGVDPTVSPVSCVLLHLQSDNVSS